MEQIYKKESALSFYYSRTTVISLKKLVILYHETILNMIYSYVCSPCTVSKIFAFCGKLKQAKGKFEQLKNKGSINVG